MSPDNPISTKPEQSEAPEASEAPETTETLESSEVPASADISDAIREEIVKIHQRQEEIIQQIAALKNVPAPKVEQVRNLFQVWRDALAAYWGE